MKGRAIAYSPDEMTWLAANRLLPISDYHAGFVAAFEREVSAQNLHALRKRRGWKTGRTGCFVKGQVPANNGKPMPFNAASAATRFKKGNRSGRAQERYKPIGTVRLSQDGYQEIKIHDGMPLQSRWRLLHLVEWEKVNGPIPEGQCLKCLNGDRLNTDPSNWLLIPRGVLSRLNGGRHKRRLAFDQAAPEVKPVLMNIAKIEHAAHELKRRQVPTKSNGPDQ
jgi:hypothetical protein